MLLMVVLALAVNVAVPVALAPYLAVIGFGLWLTLKLTVVFWLPPLPPPQLVKKSADSRERYSLRIVCSVKRGFKMSNSIRKFVSDIKMKNPACAGFFFVFQRATSV